MKEEQQTAACKERPRRDYIFLIPYHKLFDLQEKDMKLISNLAFARAFYGSIGQGIIMIIKMIK